MIKQSRKEAVLRYLLNRNGQWVPGYELNSPEVGGSEGLRRFRQARQEGWPIESRATSHGEAWEYRMVADED